MTQYNLGHVVGATGATGATGASGADGASVWNTSTAPTYANSKYTFTISNLSGRSGVTIAVNDIIFYDTYYYIVSTKNSTTVDCATRVSIKGADGSSASVTIVDNLNSDSSTSVLSAKQGKVLNTNKIETSAIATSFASQTSDSKVPSEKLTKTELDKKITKASTATGLLKDDGTVMTSGTGASNWAIGNHTHGNILNDGSMDSSSGVSSATNTNAPLIVRQSSDYEIAFGVVSAGFIKDVSAHSNIGSSSQDSQATINGLIDTALSNKITKSNSATGLLKDDGTVMTSGTGSTNWAVGNHSHGNILSGGTITTDVAYKTNNSYGKLVITNTSNKVGTISAIDVWDEIVNQLIAYGSS